LISITESITGVVGPGEMKQMRGFFAPLRMTSEGEGQIQGFLHCVQDDGIDKGKYRGSFGRLRTSSSLRSG
jgi:hypothetical protein